MAVLNIPERDVAEALNRISLVERDEWQEAITRPLESENLFPTFYTDGKYSENTREITDIFQAYKGDFAAKGEITIGAVESEIQYGQVDIKFTGEQLAVWLKTKHPNYSQAGKKPDETDFVTDFLPDFIFRRMTNELHKLAWHGVRQDRQSNVSGPFLQTFDGYDKRINDLVLAQKLRHYATGALTSTNIYAKVQEALDNMSSEYRNWNGKIYMSASMARQYSRLYKAANPHSTAVRDDVNGSFLDVPDYDYMIQPLKEMDGLNYFVIDIETSGIPNLAVLQHTTIQPIPTLRFESFERTVKGMGEAARGFIIRRYENTIRCGA